MDQHVLGLGPDVTQGLPRLGTLIQGKAENGDTHISQGSHPWGALSSDGRLCSSAGLEPLGHAWRLCTLCVRKKGFQEYSNMVLPQPDSRDCPSLGLEASQLEA